MKWVAHIVAFALFISGCLPIASFSQDDSVFALPTYEDTHCIVRHQQVILRSGAAQQSSPFKISYIDEFVRNLDTEGEKGKDIETLAHLLTDSFQTDAEKVRAIFYWITQNIAYDVKKYRTRKNVLFRCQCNRKNRVSKRKQHRICIANWQWEMAREALVLKKGICGDYALLFYYLCSFAGIESKYITGYAVAENRLLNPAMSPKQENHAWNAVKIDGKWYLLDVTWASGYCDRGMRKFTRELDERYYLTPPEIMILTHHPKEKKWQLLKRPISRKEFVQQINEQYRQNMLYNQARR